MAGQRLALLDTVVRIDPEAPDEASLQRKLLRTVAQALAPDEVVVLDAGFTLEQCQSSGLERWVVRLATNAAPRRNTPAPYKGHGLNAGRTNCWA